MQAATQQTVIALDSLNSSASGGDVDTNKFEAIKDVINQMHVQMIHTQGLLQQLLSDNTSFSVANVTSTTARTGNDVIPSKKQRKNKKTTKATQPKTEFVEEMPFIPVSVPPSVAVPPMEDSPLTHEEQEELTEAINNLTEDKVSIVIDIIKKSKQDLIDDDQEIELDLDQLDTETQ